MATASIGSALGIICYEQKRENRKNITYSLKHKKMTGLCKKVLFGI